MPLHAPLRRTALTLSRVGLCLLGGLVLTLTLAGHARAKSDVRPRVVSLDYCADQFVLKLADRDQIAGLSVEADNDYSYMRAQAAGLPQVRSLSEDVLLRKPDLIVRHWGGGPRVQAYYERFDIPVLQIDFTNTLEGVRANILKIAEGLEQPERGRALADEFERRRAIIAEKLRGLPDDERRQGLYLTPGNFTAAGGTLIGDLMSEAGLVNSAAREGRTGWVPVPLERLVLEPPEFIVAAFFRTQATRTDRWSAARHPVMQGLLESAETVYVPGSLVSCPAWFAMEAVEMMNVAAYGDDEKGNGNGS